MRWKGVEQRADLLPCGLDRSGIGLSQQQRLEPDEDLFDGFQVG